MRLSPNRIGVIGGGTAGYLTALALQRWRPELSITVVESSRIPIIGVGEATTPPLVSFLHGFLGIDIHELYRRVRPTWKLGIRFDWGQRTFNFPFGPGQLNDAHLHDGDVERNSVTSMLMTARRTPIVREGDVVGSALPRLKYAYHLDNAPFAGLLREYAERRGIARRDATIARVEVGRDAGGDAVVDHLITEAGDRLAFDFYVDCTGFRSLLLGDALGSPFVSFADSLACDRAIVANVPHDGTIKPYTLAQTMDCGWCWNIPQVDEDHRGYVFSSAACTEDQAIAEMRAANPGMTEPWVVRFAAGRRRELWRGNVAAVGNAYGFVEPLESTALDMVIVHIARLTRLLDPALAGTPDADRDRVNDVVAGHWDYLRWFLALHYRFNRRRDTPFWRERRASTDVSGLQDVIDDFRAHGPLTARGIKRPGPTTVFGSGGIDVMLLGQGVEPGAVPPMPTDAWQRLCATRAAFVASALPQREALELLTTSHAHFLDEAVTDAFGWCAVLASDFPQLKRLLG